MASLPLLMCLSKLTTVTLWVLQLVIALHFLWLSIKSLRAWSHSLYDFERNIIMQPSWSNELKACQWVKHPASSLSIACWKWGSALRFKGVSTVNSRWKVIDFVKGKFSFLICKCLPLSSVSLDNKLADFETTSIHNYCCCGPSNLLSVSLQFR